MNLRAARHRVAAECKTAFPGGNQAGSALCVQVRVATDPVTIPVVGAVEARRRPCRITLSASAFWVF